MSALLQQLADEKRLSLEQTVAMLRASGEPTRLRLLNLLSKGDLTVTELIDILGQSQPRISRHLKLLSEAGLLERYQEGAWAFFRLADQGSLAETMAQLLSHIDPMDRQIVRDLERLEAVKKRRADKATEYFALNAGEWDKIRSLHVDEKQVEAAMLDMVGAEKIGAMLDLGTGTGRILELFAGIYDKGTGIDASRDMLAIARSRLDGANLSRVQTRQGDLYILPTPAGSVDLVTIHQVLHFLEDPGAAINEAAKALVPGGRLLIVDFAPHELEFLRDEHAHLRLGFSDEQINEWLNDASLKPVRTEHLVPHGDGKNAEKLTVSLWLAQKHTD